MALSDFKPETRTVSGRGYSFDVRGLGMNDIASMMRTHMDDLENVFKLYEQHSGDEITTVALGRFALALVKDAPGLTAHAIALASDEPQAVENAARLPFMAQVSALKEIGQLTFVEIGGVKKLIENLDGLLNGLRPGDSNQDGTDLTPSSTDSEQT